jgi:hypothetical protein
MNQASPMRSDRQAIELFHLVFVACGASGLPAIREGEYGHGCITVT